MKTAWMLGLVMAAELSARTTPVAVCLKNAGIAQQFVLYRAKVVATAMFESIGVPVEWRCGSFHGQRIVIQLDGATPADFKSGTLGYARPYANSGAVIHVFYDRVRDEHPPSLTGVLLGHVLAHEITHVLQGIARHSDAGVMKEHWGTPDFKQMDLRPLPFTPADVELIEMHMRRPAAL